MADYESFYDSDDASSEPSIINNNEQTEKYIAEKNQFSCFSSEGNENSFNEHEIDVSEFLNQFSFDTPSVPTSNEASEQVPIQPEDEVPQNIGTHKSAIIKSTDTQSLIKFSWNLQNGIILTSFADSIAVDEQPNPNQHTRYGKESNKTLRFNKACDGKHIRVLLPPGLSDLWNFSREKVYEPWLQITRITVESSGIFARHPYPIWMKMKNNQIVSYNGSLYIRITESDIKNGYIEITNLVLITIKQDELDYIDTLATYNESTMMFSGSCYVGKMNAKEKIESYKFRQSALHFQIVLTDVTNILYPTDNCCKTIDMTEFAGSRPSSNENGTHTGSGKRKRKETEIQLPSSKPKEPKISTNARFYNESGRT